MGEMLFGGLRGHQERMQIMFTCSPSKPAWTLKRGFSFLLIPEMSSDFPGSFFFFFLHLSRVQTRPKTSFPSEKHLILCFLPLLFRQGNHMNS